MKVFAINGSARKDGNTAILINTVFEELNKEEIETEMVQLSGSIIEPCKACRACGGRKNCVHGKNQFQEIFEKMTQANGIILAIVLSLVMLLTLTACGNTDASEGQKEPYNLAALPSEQGTVQKPETEEHSEMQQGEVQQDEAGQEMSQQEISGQETVPAKESDGPGAASPKEQETDMDTKILVVYFSCTGTTKPLAEYAAEILGADLYEIVPEEPYTEADLAYYTNGRADREQNDPDSRPAISGSVDNMDQYETIVIGYPIWHGQAPRIVNTFLESYDFAGKTIVPFCTSHSSGIGSSASNLHTLCSDSTVWSEGRRFEAGTSKDTIAEWLGSE